MIRAIIVEDEIPSRNTLRKMLIKHCPNVDIIHEAREFNSGLESIIKNKPDLIFLDIQLSESNPKENGFELLKRIPDLDFHLIFTTSFLDRAEDAINLDSRTCFFLTKPFNLNKLIEAVSRVELKILQKKINQNPIYARSHIKGRLPISGTNGIEFVPFSQIVMLVADGSWTKMYLWRETKPKVICHHLAWFESHFELDEHKKSFLRPHRAYIVNIDYIKEFVHDGHSGKIILENGLVAMVSEEKKKFVLQSIKEF
ncbi:MAG: response regulator transcription factor [Saprospiraceae bacterium]|nr:response regulator transcription factor [Saprospiraceae bacterium]MBK7810629.1 response regulator transcription factor [Saprospiraceae bacterium]MBK9630221.1 response regulator transcription factor [Saprospiraceae bacterium]